MVLEPSLNIFCTIVTSSFVHYAQTLFASLKTFDRNAKLTVLIVDDGDLPSDLSDSIIVLRLADIVDYDKMNFNIIDKYRDDIHENLRYGLKPVLINYLLEEVGYEKVFCLDSDLFFYSSSDFLFNKLDGKGVLLSPHWRSSDPFKDPTNFHLLFQGGLYNAGFVGASRKGIEAIKWWAKACSYKLEKALEKGLFCDQTYLNLIPIQFNEQTEVLQHKGCNISNWNMVDCERSINKGEVVIDGKWPVVFIHFTKSTINGIVRGEDNLLEGYLESYLKTLSNFSDSTNSLKELKIEFESIKPSFKSKVKSVVKKIVK